jgi:hypothetical protein
VHLGLPHPYTQDFPAATCQIHTAGALKYRITKQGHVAAKSLLLLVTKHGELPILNKLQVMEVCGGCASVWPQHALMEMVWKSKEQNMTLVAGMQRAHEMEQRPWIVPCIAHR